MTLATDEFVRRFLIHVLPRGFHRIRHYGLLASSTHKDTMALARNCWALLYRSRSPNPTNLPTIARHAHVAAGP
jgi:hypothetical protein